VISGFSLSDSSSLSLQDSASYEAGIPVTMKAYVEDAYTSTPASGVGVVFKYRVSGSADWITAGSATTDSLGRAQIVVYLEPGTYDFRAEAGGDYVEILGASIAKGVSYSNTSYGTLYNISLTVQA
jgi:hypothetical protein